MSRTFYDALVEVAQQLASLRTGTATGGSTTTLIDTNLVDEDGFFDDGFIFIDQATPVIAQITSFAADTFTFTFPAISSAVVAGVTYSAMDDKYPLDVLKRAVNQCLRHEIGQIMQVVESLTAV